MKNHAAFKFLAIVLCAACLFAAVISGVGLAALAAMNLGENASPREYYQADIQRSIDTYAESIVMRCAARRVEGADQTFVEDYYDYVDRLIGRYNMNYQVLTKAGRVLEESNVVSGDTEYRSTVKAGQVSYAFYLEGPVSVTEDQDLQAEEAKLLGREVYMEDYSDGTYVYDIRTDSDGTYVYDIRTNSGWDLYKYQEVPLEEDYTVIMTVLPDSVDNSLDARLMDLMDIVWRYQTQVMILLGVSIALFGVLAVYLCMAAGHKPGTEEIRPGGLNCLPLDLYLGAVMGLGLMYCYFGIEGVRYLMGQSNAILFAYYGYGGYACCLIFVGFCFACAAQFKTPGFYWWHHSLTGLCWKGLVWCWKFFWKCVAWCYHIVWVIALPILQWTLGLVKKGWAFVKKLWKGFCGFLGKTYGLLPLSWQWILAGGLLVGICPLALATDSLLLLWIGLLGGAALVIYGAVNFGTLLDAAKRMRAGDLDIKIDERHMLGAFRDFALELNGLSDVVQVAAQKQMKSERMRTELITNVSHDIKTPLTSIINYVDLLQKPHNEEEGEKYLEVLSRQSARMKRLIDDLIELSKASTGNIPVNLTKIDAVEAVNQALGEFTDKLSAAELMPKFCQPEEPLYICADGRLVWRAMSNLLSNAVKYALPGTRLYIDMVAVDKKVCISFKNISRDPLNISAEELMERFVRGEASRNQEGSGLGLNIAQSMMELQHGSLELLVDGDLFKATLIFPQEADE